MQCNNSIKQCIINIFLTIIIRNNNVSNIINCEHNPYKYIGK